ncbi:hypothetical protein GNX_0654 [Leptospira interrogans serovar Canicola]|nr:hypothetical protein GNX_0654 [Leptospira interrogans serovar Canicola]
MVLTLLTVGILFLIQVRFGLPINIAIMNCIFVLAAVFWVLEPIPGYATSILVIFFRNYFFLQILSVFLILSFLEIKIHQLRSFFLLWRILLSYYF